MNNKIEEEGEENKNENENEEEKKDENKNLAVQNQVNLVIKKGELKDLNEKVLKSTHEEIEFIKETVKRKVVAINVKQGNKKYPCFFNVLEYTKGDQTYCAIEVNQKWLDNKELKISKKKQKILKEKYKQLLENDLNFQRKVVSKLQSQLQLEHIDTNNVLLVDKFDGMFSDKDLEKNADNVFMELEKEKNNKKSFFYNNSLEMLSKKIANDKNKHYNKLNDFKGLVYNKCYRLIDDILLLDPYCYNKTKTKKLNKILNKMKGFKKKVAKDYQSFYFADKENILNCIDEAKTSQFESILEEKGLNNNIANIANRTFSYFERRYTK